MCNYNAGGSPLDYAKDLLLQHNYYYTKQPKKEWSYTETLITLIIMSTTIFSRVKVFSNNYSHYISLSVIYYHMFLSLIYQLKWTPSNLP